MATGQLTRELLTGHVGRVETLAASGSMIVSGATDTWKSPPPGVRAGATTVPDHTLKVWALTGEDSIECIATLKGHSANVTSVVAGPDMVASASENEIIVWRPA